MEREKALRNIALYKWYILLKEPLMWGPILITCLMRLGHMKLDEIYFMEAIVLLGFIFLEPPSGALADYIGRKKMVAIGAFLEIISVSWFACIQTPFDVWGANIMWMIGYSFASGANTSLIYDTLKELDMEYTFEKLQSDTYAHNLLLTAFFCLFAGVLADINLRLPVLLSIPGVVVCFGITLRFTETGAVKEKLKKQSISLRDVVLILKTSIQAIHNLMKISLLFVANNKEVKWIVIFSTIITVGSKVWFFTYNPYFALVKLDIRYYGLIFFFLNIVAWYFCKHAYDIKNRLGEKNVILLLLLSVGLPIVLMGTFVNVFSVSLVLLQNVVRGISVPFFSSFLHSRISSENRATVDSLRSATNGLCQFLALGAYGFVLDAFGLPYSLQILGYIILILGAYALYKYKKVFVAK